MSDYEIHELESSTCSISKYRGHNHSLIIPSEIKGLKVTSIGYAAFADNNLTSVTIPKGVTFIDAYAFYNNQLTTLTIPETVTETGYSAFAHNRITSLFLPNSTRMLTPNSFYNNCLASVIIPDNVESIGFAVFANNPLKRVIVPDHTKIEEDAFDPGCEIIRTSDQNKLIAELLNKKHTSTQLPGNLAL